MKSMVVKIRGYSGEFPYLNISILRAANRQILRQNLSRHFVRVFRLFGLIFELEYQEYGLRFSSLEFVSCKRTTDQNANKL